MSQMSEMAQTIEDLRSAAATIKEAADWLAQQEGFFPGYHISRGSWVSILLDGTVPQEEIFLRIDESFAVTAAKPKRRKSKS